MPATRSLLEERASWSASMEPTQAQEAVSVTSPASQDCAATTSVPITDTATQTESVCVTSSVDTTVTSVTSTRVQAGPRTALDTERAMKPCTSVSVNLVGAGQPVTSHNAQEALSAAG